MSPLAKLRHRLLVRIEVARMFKVHLPRAIFHERSEPVWEIAVRVSAEHEAHDALLRHDLPDRVCHHSFAEADARGLRDRSLLRVGLMVIVEQNGMLCSTALIP